MLMEAYDYGSLCLWKLKLMGKWKHWVLLSVHGNISKKIYVCKSPRTLNGTLTTDTVNLTTT